MAHLELLAVGPILGCRSCNSGAMPPKVPDSFSSFHNCHSNHACCSTASTKDAAASNSPSKLRLEVRPDRRSHPDGTHVHVLCAKRRHRHQQWSSERPWISKAPHDSNFGQFRQSLLHPPHNGSQSGRLPIVMLSVDERHSCASRRSAPLPTQIAFPACQPAQPTVTPAVPLSPELGFLHTRLGRIMIPAFISPDAMLCPQGRRGTPRSTTSSSAPTKRSAPSSPRNSSSRSSGKLALSKPVILRRGRHRARACPGPK